MKKTIYKIYDPGNNFLISVNSWEQVGGVICQYRNNCQIKEIF